MRRSIAGLAQTALNLARNESACLEAAVASTSRGLHSAAAASAPAIPQASMTSTSQLLNRHTSSGLTGRSAAWMSWAPTSPAAKQHPLQRARAYHHHVTTATTSAGSSCCSTSGGSGALFGRASTSGGWGGGASTSYLLLRPSRGFLTTRRERDRDSGKDGGAPAFASAAAAADAALPSPSSDASLPSPLSLDVERQKAAQQGRELLTVNVGE